MSLLLLVRAAAAVAPDAPDSRLNVSDHPWAARLQAEAGWLAPLAHTIQLGRDGTRFDYVAEGGQDVLFPYARLQADLDLGERHTIAFLYQPLDLRTSVRFERDVVIDGETFAAGTPMDLRYGFDFWRASWLYDLQAAPEREAGLGLSLQIRDANLDFASADGEQRRDERDVGPVPVLKARIRQPLGEGGAWIGAEADGFWAPIRYLNGGRSDVEGAILDASLRAGLPLGGGVDGFLSLRYLGGGAQGTSEQSTPPGDGYVENWLHFAALSAGAQIR